MNHQAIYNTHSNVVSIRAEVPYDSDNNEVTINQSLVDTELTRLQAAYDSQQYARDRAEAYPSIADQLDKIYHSGVAGWKADIKVIKDANPKPE
jgi:hypothetical protein